MRALAPEVRDAAERTLRYLAETDAMPTAPADAVIGFGVFDLALPRYCADLYVRGLARRIVFTGGIGAGTGNLGGPEAEIWRAEVRRSHPEIPDHVFVLENRSTNTSENIAFTAALLARGHAGFSFGRGLRNTLIVASPSRMRRVQLSMRKQQPDVGVTRLLPRVDLDAEYALYTRQGVDYLGHLVGELDRIATYPARGWIASEVLPTEIVAAGDVLRAALAKP